MFISYVLKNYFHEYLLMKLIYNKRMLFCTRKYPRNYTKYARLSVKNAIYVGRNVFGNTQECPHGHLL